MKQSRAWVIQAHSDLVAADTVFNQQEDSTYCQAISKYQQAVEKSVKAIVAGLAELGTAGVVIGDVTSRHTLDHELRVLEAVQRKKRDIDTASVSRISAILTDKQRLKTKALCGYAPKWPPPGQPFPMNTEYPFHLDVAQDEWTAPAASGSFSLEAVKGAQQLAWPLYRRTKTTVDLLRRKKR